jgi:hypothetical protein
MVYPALLPLMSTPRLPVVDWTDVPADLNGLVRFAERRNLVSVRVPSHFNWPLLGKGWCAGDVTSTSQFVTPNKFSTSRGIQWMFVWTWWLYRPGARCRSAIWFCAKREHGEHVNSRLENWPHVPHANMFYRKYQLLLRYFLRTRTLLCEFWVWRSRIVLGCCSPGSWSCCSG